MVYLCILQATNNHHSQTAIVLKNVAQQGTVTFKKKYFFQYSTAAKF